VQIPVVEGVRAYALKGKNNFTAGYARMLAQDERMRKRVTHGSPTTWPHQIERERIEMIGL